MRILRKISVPLFAGFIASIFLYAYLAKPFDSERTICPINGLFGLHCLTCGATRAAYSLIFFDFKSAFYYNALFTVVIIPFAVFGLLYTVNFAFNKRVVPLPRIKAYYFIVGAAICAVFTILRNITDIIY